MLRRFFNDTKKYWSYTIQVTKARLKAEVADSYLNWIWWVLQPICFTAIYALVFGVFFGLAEKYSVAFIVVGVTIWDFFNRTIKQAVTVMKKNKSVVSRVYLPKYVLIYESIGVNGFKMAISMMIVIAMMIYYQVHISFRILFAIPVLIVLIAITYGISCFLLHFGVYVADLSNVVDIILRLLFYLTGIFYSVSKRIPAPYGHIMSRINPIAFLIDSLRKVLLYDEMPGWRVLTCWFVFSFVLAYLGTLLVYKNENSYVKSI